MQRLCLFRNLIEDMLSCSRRIAPKGLFRSRNTLIDYRTIGSCKGNRSAMDSQRQNALFDLHIESGIGLSPSF